MKPRIRVPRQPRSATLVEIFAAEEEQDRICDYCGLYVSHTVIHVVMDGKPFHFECWHDHHDPKNYMQMRLL